MYRVKTVKWMDERNTVLQHDTPDFLNDRKGEPRTKSSPIIHSLQKKKKRGESGGASLLSPNLDEPTTNELLILVYQYTHTCKKKIKKN